MRYLALEELKQVLKLDHDEDDSLLERLEDQAVAFVEHRLGRTIATTDATRVVRPSYDPATGEYSRLLMPRTPATVASVTDADGVAVAAEDYRYDARTGVLETADDSAWASARYTVVAAEGFAAHPLYDTVTFPALESLLTDLVAYYHSMRDPSATYESGGGGVAVTRSTSANEGLPSRIELALDAFRLRFC
jgi:hypothetical protein